MVETTTAEGVTERGYGQQRQFVRAVADIDGASVVISHSTGTVAVSGATAEGTGRVLDLAAEFGVDAGIEKLTDSHLYSHDGALNVVAEFESAP